MNISASAFQLWDSPKSPELAARDLLRRAWNGTVPVEPVQIARSLGLLVRPVEHRGYSGWYRRGDGTIEYDRNEPFVRQRFTIAHEIGHHVLGHADSPRDTPDEFSARSSSAIERSANQFAAELLMPAEAMRRVVQSGRVSSVDQLAKMFKVSKVAMTFRLNNLNLPY